MTYLRPILLAAALVAAAAPAPASAAPCEAGAFCKCAPVEPADAFAAAEAVFRGVVVSSRDVEGQGRLHTVRVERVWKGAVGAEVVVAEPLHGTSCSLFIEPGTPFLFTARRGEDGGLSQGPCGNVDAEFVAGRPSTAPAGATATPAAPAAQRVARAALRREVLRQVRTLLQPRTFAAVVVEAGMGGPGSPQAQAADEIAATLLLDPRIYTVVAPQGGAVRIVPAPLPDDRVAEAAVRQARVVLRVTAEGGVVRVVGTRRGADRPAFVLEAGEA
jgi:hypothetical protein